MHVVLRKWSGSDAAELAGILSEDDVHEFISDLPRPYTQKNAMEYIAAALNSSDGNFRSFAIEADGRLAGCISAERGKNVYRMSAEIGYYIAKPLWGMGIATAAVGKLVQLIFDNTDIIRIYSTVFAGNAASARVLEKCGFRREGTLKCALAKNGRLHDAHIYALIKVETLQ